MKSWVLELMLWFWKSILDANNTILLGNNTGESTDTILADLVCTEFDIHALATYP